MAGNRKIPVKGIIISVIIIILIITPFIAALFSSYMVLIKDNRSEFYTAKALIIFGDTLICLKDKSAYKKKKWALVPDVERELTFLSMTDISFMEILPGAGEEEYSAISGSTEFFGIYKVDVSGNDGYLYIKFRNGRVYGSIRFPHWANGSFEPLKRLRIYKDGRISFIRSVESLEEAKKVGVGTFFTQWYYGNYKKNGNEIHGDYTSRGAESAWRAYKIK